MKYTKDQILTLRNQGKTYQEIMDILGCAKSTITYHLLDGYKAKNYRRVLKRRNSHPYIKKIESFSYRTTKPKKRILGISSTTRLIYDKIKSFHRDKKTNMHNPITFNANDVIEKFGENPTCYLTGDQIDINKPRTYNFDHKVPATRGGDNSLDNLGICTRHANLAKTDMTHDEFVAFCKKVLVHHGYQVTKV
jgi:5-methylcytosine-specific restriction endonuclease McrA